MFETILVPTDGSDHANRAIDIAAQLADSFEARLIILHVLPSNASAPDLVSLCKKLSGAAELIDKLDALENNLANYATTYGPVPARVPDDLIEEIGGLITGNARQLAEANGAKNIKILMRNGSPADLILAAAEQENADAIVMGSRGLGHIMGMLVGSVSHKVSHLSKCTCITVK